MEEKVTISVEHINSIPEGYKTVKLKDGIEIKVKDSLSMEEYIYLINNTVSACFDVENGVYYPEAKEYAFRMAVVEAYTNLVLPDDVEAYYKYVEYIWNDIKGAIDKEQLRNLDNAVNKSVEFKKEEMIAYRQREIAVLMNKFAEFGGALENAFSDVNMDKLNEAIEVLNKMQTEQGAEEIADTQQTPTIVK